VIQGEWTLQLIRSNGQSLNKPTPSRLGKVDTAIKGLGTVTFSESDVKIAPNGELSLFPNSSFFRPTNGTYRIDVSHTPWTIDLVMPDFSGKPQTIEAVYSRDGNVLRLCLPTGANMSRPTEVSGEQGKSSAVWQLVRIE
jgi:uncharacterized protein (TIGR03067 family)